jgi:hypothetical protein
VIHHGDLFAVLPTLDAESIDACVTDPPYGIGFMGRKWDTFKPGEETKRIVPNRAIDSDNPNLRGRTRGPASSPSAVEYNYTLAGLREFEAWTESWAREVFRVLKPGAYILVCAAPRSYHRMACGLEDAGFVIRDKFSWLFGQGFPKNYNLGDGKGTALKPAHEPIALAWKPFKGSIKACHERYGTAALNIDACRLPCKPFQTNHGSVESEGWRLHNRETKDFQSHDLGRWPSNVLLDEEAAALLDQMTGELTSGGTPEFRDADKFRNAYGAFKGGQSENGIGGSRGGASRFYKVVDWRDSTTDNESCDQPRGATFENLTAAGIESGENPEVEESISSLNTDGSGSKRTGESLPDTKSTTAITTRATMDSKTSNSSRPRGTTAVRQVPTHFRVRYSIRRNLSGLLSPMQFSQPRRVAGT